jgi:AcrR family transcriptional regulator
MAAIAASGPRRRADAVRNYERVVQAAAEVLAEKGIEAAVPEIATRAGVGKGTVYRCFPTKEHLVAAVLTERLRGFARLAEEAAERPDAWGAFVDFLVEIAERTSGDCCLAEAMGRASELPEVQQARGEVETAINRLIARAQAQGRMRADVTSADLRVLYAGAARVLHADKNRDQEAWRRYAHLIADALSTRAG